MINLNNLEALDMFDQDFFNSLQEASLDNLPEASEALRVARERVAQELSEQHLKRAKLAYRYIMLKHMIEVVGGKTSVLGAPMFQLLVSKTAWFNKPTGTKHIHSYVQAIEYVFGKDAPQVEHFRQGLLKDYLLGWVYDEKSRVATRVDFHTGAVVESFNMKDTPLVLDLTSRGLKISLKAGDKIQPSQGKQFVFESPASYTFNVSEINTHLVKVLQSIRIHDEATVVDVFTGAKTTVFSEKSYKFKKEDALVLLVLMKANGIDLTTIRKAVVNGRELMLVLSRQENNKGVKSLSRVFVPAATFAEKYGLTGVVSTSEAKMGIVSPMVSLPRMVEFVEDNNHMVVRTREAVNKTVSRLDKLNNSKELWAVKTKFFIVKDATQYPKLNEALFGGCGFFTNSWVESNGFCRVVSEMDQGGVKSATAPLKMLDSKLAKGDINIIAASALKGGLLAAFGLATDRPDYLGNLVKLAANKEGATLIQIITESMDKLCTTMVINGQEVEGIYCTINLKVTNCYSIDMLMDAKEEVDLNSKEAIKAYIENLEAEMENSSRTPTGFRAEMSRLKAEDSNNTVLQYVSHALHTGKARKKPLYTRIIAQEIQSVAAWYGTDVAEQWLDALLTEQLYDLGVEQSKLYALQYIGAMPFENVSEVSVEDILDILGKVEKDSSVYSKEVGETLLEVFGEEYGWVKLVYQNKQEVLIPTGRVAVNDLQEQLEDSSKTYVITKGLVNNILENIKNMVNSKGELFSTTNNHQYAEVLVGKTLLGKSFGYQVLKGYYGVILPLVNNSNGYAYTTAGITNRNRLVSDDVAGEYTKMTLTKAPQYFKGSTASYDVMDVDLGKGLNLLAECVVFVNPHAVMMFQNDFDGDMMRITTGADVLPYVSELSKEFNGKFFSSFVEEELEGNFLKAKVGETIDIKQYHEAVLKAVKAKEAVGSYTANSYFYEAMLPNLIGKSFESIVNGIEYTVTQEDYYVITALLKMLIQVEAMNNMKQEGATEFVTELLFSHRFAGMKETSSRTLAEVVQYHFNKAAKLLTVLSEAYEMNLDIQRILDIMYHVSVTYRKNDLTTSMMFNTRCVDEKAIQEIAISAANSAIEYKGVYNFRNSYDRVLEGSDTCSMYRSIILKTLDMVQYAKEGTDTEVVGFKG